MSIGRLILSIIGLAAVLYIIFRKGASPEPSYVALYVHILWVKQNIRQFVALNIIFIHNLDVAAAQKPNGCCNPNTNQPNSDRCPGVTSSCQVDCTCVTYEEYGEER